ncbi:CENP-B protein, partial [Zopfia rhizophila CBS 207.26]
ITVRWLQHFNEYIRPHIIGIYCLLILDSHNSHVSLGFVQACKEIIPLCLPSHTTHVLQPLNVGVFRPLAKAYKKEVKKNSLFGAERITNREFLLYFQRARQQAI